MILYFNSNNNINCSIVPFKQLQTQSILDLILANNRNNISGIEVIPVISDHDIVRFSIN